MTTHASYLNEHGQAILNFLREAYEESGRGAGLIVEHDNARGTSKLAYYKLAHIIEDQDQAQPQVESYDPEREGVLIVGQNGTIFTYVLRQARPGRVQVGQAVGSGLVAWGCEHLVEPEVGA